VNVVRHDHPSEKPVTLRVEIQEGGLDDSSGNRITEGAASVAGIDPSFEPFSSLSVPLGIRKKDDFAVKALDGVLRNAVGEMIGDVLKGAGRIKVRQVAAAVPSRIAHFRRTRFPGSAVHQNGFVYLPGSAVHQNGFVYLPGSAIHQNGGASRAAQAMGTPRRRRAGRATGVPGRLVRVAHGSPRAQDFSHIPGTAIHQKGSFVYIPGSAVRRTAALFKFLGAPFAERLLLASFILPGLSQVLHPGSH
jgi:hypothetical protein